MLTLCCSGLLMIEWGVETVCVLIEQVIGEDVIQKDLQTYCSVGLLWVTTVLPTESLFHWQVHPFHSPQPARPHNCASPEKDVVQTRLYTSELPQFFLPLHITNFKSLAPCKRNMIKNKHEYITEISVYLFSAHYSPPPPPLHQTWAAAGWWSQPGKLLEICFSSPLTDGQEGLSNWHSSMLLHSRSIGK